MPVAPLTARCAVVALGTAEGDVAPLAAISIDTQDADRVGRAPGRSFYGATMRLQRSALKIQVGGYKPDQMGQKQRFQAK